MKVNYDCPSCGAKIVAVQPEATFRCGRCGWHLFTLAAWKKLTPFQQGFALYSQGSWPTSEIADESNPYAEGSRAWGSFREGERRAALAAQDSDE